MSPSGDVGGNIIHSITRLTHLISYAATIYNGAKIFLFLIMRAVSIESPVQLKEEPSV